MCTCMHMLLTLSFSQPTPHTRTRIEHAFISLLSAAHYRVDILHFLPRWISPLRAPCWAASAHGTHGAWLYSVRYHRLPNSKMDSATRCSSRMLQFTREISAATGPAALFSEAAGWVQHGSNSRVLNLVVYFKNLHVLNLVLQLYR